MAGAVLSGGRLYHTVTKERRVPPCHSFHPFRTYFVERFVASCLLNPFYHNFFSSSPDLPIPTFLTSLLPFVL